MNTTLKVLVVDAATGFYQMKRFTWVLFMDLWTWICTLQVSITR